MDTGADQMLKIQTQVRQNQQELSEYIKDLGVWEDDIKEKESQLKCNGSTAGETLQTFPPVRNSLQQKKKKKVFKEKCKDKTKPISGYDFKAWDKFDVDKALEEIDTRDGEDSESEYETDEEWEVERLKQQALLEKDRGNSLFKAGNYDGAVECYTAAIDCDPTNPVLPANRAMALLKQNKYAEAECDCTLSLSLDPLYIKAYLRRASARTSLNNHGEAIKDYETVINLDPSNTLASNQIQAIRLKQKKTTATPEKLIPAPIHVMPIYKPPELRSKAPLYRVPIEEIGVDDDVTKHDIKRRIASQSHTKQRLTETDERNFNLLINDQQNTFDTVSRGVENMSSPNLKEISSRKITPESHRNGKLLVNDQHNAFDKVIRDGIDENLIDNKTTPVLKEITTESHYNGLTSNNGLESSAYPSQSGHREQVTSCQQGDNKQKSPRERYVANISCQKRDEVKILPRQQIDVNISPRQRDEADKSPRLPNLPDVPKNSLQFQCDWRKLRGHPKLLYEYMRQINVNEYKRLIGQFLDADVLMGLVNVVKDFYIPNGVNVYPVLEGLAQVNRFSMVSMFLTHQNKSSIQDILSASKSLPYFNQQTNDKISKLYGVT